MQIRFFDRINSMSQGTMIISAHLCLNAKAETYSNIFMNSRQEKMHGSMDSMQATVAPKVICFQDKGFKGEESLRLCSMPSADMTRAYNSGRLFSECEYK